MLRSARPAGSLPLVLVFLFSPGTAPAEVVKGPYLVDMTPSSTRIRLEADVLLPTEVRFWPEGDPSAARTFIALPETLSAQVRCLSAESSRKTLDREETHYLYDAQLLGISPGTAYVYEVLQGGAPRGGGRFRTFESSPERTRFIVLGDVRTGHEFHRELALQFRAHRPDFVAITGDLAADGKVYTEWQPFFDIEKEFFHDIPIIPAWGNHDGRSGYFERYFPYPRRSSTRSIDCGPVHMAVIDSSNAEEPEELRWIDQDLAAARDRPWKVALYHHPSFNEGGHASAYGLSKLIPLLKLHKVDLTLTGHSHLYERTFPLKSALKDEQPIVHIVTGGGGAPLASDADAFYLAAHSMRHHYLLIEADRETLTGTAIGLDGRPFDRFTMTRPVRGVARGSGDPAGGKAAIGGTDGGGIGSAAPAPGSAGVPSARPSGSEVPAAGSASGGAPPPASAGAAEKVVAEEAVALWRGLRGAFDTRARFRIPEAKEGKPAEPLPGPVVWLFRASASPISRRVPVEVRLSLMDRERWSLTPEVLRFDWGPESVSRLLAIRPKTAEALTRQVPPLLEVRVQNILVGFFQSIPLKVGFSREGKTTRRARF